MHPSALARPCLMLTSAVALTGLTLQAVATATSRDGQFATPAGRLLNLLCYFTIESNILVAVTTLLALRRRRAPWFTPLWLATVVAITVTGLIYHLVLAGDVRLTGLAWVADLLLHTVTPVLGVLCWLVFGPRTRPGARDVLLALAFPLLYLGFTLIRGPIVDFYPYPFLDVRVSGYPRVALNSAMVAVLFVALTAGAAALDRRLGAGEPRTSAGRSA